MDLKQLTIASATFAAVVFSTPATANVENNCDTNCSQNFSGMHSGSWQLVHNHNHSDKAVFVEADGTINFDAQWSRKALRKFWEAGHYFGMDASTAWQDLDVKAYRAAVEASCEAMLEIGNAGTYGLDSSIGQVTELDTDAKHCGLPNAASVRLRSWIPTTPGATYKLTVNWHNRPYNNGSLNEKQEHRKLAVRFGNQKVMQPLHRKVGPGQFEMIADGDAEHQPVEITFTASKFYTRLSLGDRSEADSYGVLISNVAVEETMSNDRNCDAFKPYSGTQRQCYTYSSSDAIKISHKSSSGRAQAIWEGDLSVESLDTQDYAYRTAQGYHYRSDPMSLISTDATDRHFLSLKQRGVVTITPLASDGNGGYTQGALDVTRATVSFDEITWGNHTFATYPEQAFVKAWIAGCDNSDMNGAMRLNNHNSVTNTPKWVRTKESFGFIFDSNYDGCQMFKMSIHDRTNKLGHAGSDGVDLRNLQINNAIVNVSPPVPN